MTTTSKPNSWISQDGSATTQLTYALQLNPAPLTVSLAQRDPVLGALQFVLTNPTASPISVSSVSFTILVGTTSSNLTTSTANVGTSVSDSTNWLMQSPGTITSGPATYTLQPQTGSSVSIAAGASVIVEIFDFPTIQNPGNSIITIKEAAGASGFTAFQVTTFPTGFYFNGLSATIESSSQLVPIAQVGAGASVTLVWNSSIVDLASIAIFYSNAAQGQQKSTPSQIGIWTSPALSTETVFTVVVTVSVEGGSPLTAALSTSVSVQNPALIAGSITAGQATVSGPTVLTGSLGVTGPSTVGSLNASSLGVSGTSTLASATVNGPVNINSTLGVSGASTLANITVNDSLSALGLAALTGGLQLGGPVAALKNAVVIQPGSYGPAPTDGFLMGYCAGPSGSGGFCMCYITGVSGGVTIKAYGGNIQVLYKDSNNWAQSILPGNFLLPVQQGNTFQATVWYFPLTPGCAPTTFWWIPLGSSATPAQMTALRLGDAETTEEHLVTYKHD